MRSVWKNLPKDQGEWNWLQQAWPESWSLVRLFVLGDVQTSCPASFTVLPPLSLPFSSSFSPYLVYISHSHSLCISMTRIFERIKGGKGFLTRGFGGITMKASTCKWSITVLNFHLRSTFVLDRRGHLTSFIIIWVSNWSVITC